MERPGSQADPTEAEVTSRPQGGRGRGQLRVVHEARARVLATLSRGTSAPNHRGRSALHLCGAALGSEGSSSLNGRAPPLPVLNQSLPLLVRAGAWACDQRVDQWVSGRRGTAWPGQPGPVSSAGCPDFLATPEGAGPTRNAGRAHPAAGPWAWSHLRHRQSTGTPGSGPPAAGAQTPARPTVPPGGRAHSRLRRDRPAAESALLRDTRSDVTTSTKDE